jgi:nucleoside-diphosphate-sugar epimerase
MKKILISGSTGFIGTNLIEFFSKKYEVYALVRSFKKKIIKKNIKYILYSDFNKFLKNNSINYFIHAAAQSPTLGTKIDDYIKSNIKLTNFFINKSITYGIKNFIFLSSLSIYGESKNNFIDEKTEIINPSDYGISKLICEKIIIQNANKINFSIIRLPGVVGKNSVRNWLTNILADVKSNKEINIYNPNHKFNNIIHVNDLCKFINILIKLDILKNDILCISSTQRLTIKNIILNLVFLTNSKSKINIKKKKVKSFYIRNSKILKNYNFKPMTTKETLLRFVNENIN